MWWYLAVALASRARFNLSGTAVLRYRELDGNLHKPAFYFFHLLGWQIMRVPYNFFS